MEKRRQASRVVSAIAAAAALLCQSCVNDVSLPQEPTMEWTEILVPQYCSNLDVTALASDEHGALYQGTMADYPMIWRSDDQGRTWEMKARGINPCCAVTSLLAKGTEIIFAGLSGGGIFISRDRGESWTQINNHLTDLHIRSMATLFGGEIFAATDSGRIFRSANDGGVWSQVEDESIETPVNALAADSAGIIYAGCLGQGIFISENGGGSWRESSDGLANLSVRCLAVQRDGYVLAGTDGGGIYRSAGGGEPWVRIDRGATESDIYAITIDASGYIFAGTNGEGVIRSGDGGDSWERADNGVQGLRIISLLYADGVLHAGTVHYGSFRSINQAGSWSGPMEYRNLDEWGSNYGFIFFMTDSSDTYYLLNGQAVFRSSDCGTTWVRACRGLSSHYEPDKNIYCLGVRPNGSIFAGTDEGIFVSTDYGNRWTRSDTFSTEPPSVRRIEVTANGVIFGDSREGILRSADGGSSWDYVYDRAAQCMSAGADSSIYLGTSHGGVMRSTDCGSTWQQVTDSMDVYSIDADRVGNVFATHYGNSFLLSRDGGDSWRAISWPGLYEVRQVLAAPGGGTALVVGSGRKLFMSYDCFSNRTTIDTPYDLADAYLSPRGYLFATTYNSRIMYRTTHPLF